MKQLVLLTLLFGFKSMAYHPCEVKGSINHYADYLCFAIPQDLTSPYQGESRFSIQAALLTESNKSISSKDTLVLIPGGPGNDSEAIRLTLNSKDIINALWKHDQLNVAYYDPRGTGASLFTKSAEFYPQEVYYTERQIDDLKKVVDSVSPKKPVYLLAHSAGGNIAAKFAQLYPKRVKGLILYSASIDTREIGESNLRLFAYDFKFWDLYLTTLDTKVATTLDKDRQFIEAFLRNGLKFNRLKGQVTLNAAAFYLKDFRVDLIRAIENAEQSKNQRVIKTLNTWKEKIKKVPDSVQSEVMKLSDLKFTFENNTLPVLKRSNWIKTAVICSEGLTKNEMKEPLWLEGLNFEDDTCYGMKALYVRPPSRNWLKEITTPTLLIGGSEDPFQIPSAVVANGKAIPNAKVLIFEGAGHEAHLTHAWPFYQAISDFIKSTR